MRALLHANGTYMKNEKSEKSKKASVRESNRRQRDQQLGMASYPLLHMGFRVLWA